MYIVQSIHIWERVQDEKKQERQKCPAGTRQTVGKTGVWFGEIERKLAKLSKTTFTYRFPLNFLMVLSIAGGERGIIRCYDGWDAAKGMQYRLSWQGLLNYIILVQRNNTARSTLL
jgi:hypothetical protein